MDTPDFKIFSRAVHARYELLSKNELFTVDVICPLSQLRNPVWPDVAARGALLAERAVKLCEGIASLKDHSI